MEIMEIGERIVKEDEPKGHDRQYNAIVSFLFL